MAEIKIYGTLVNATTDPKIAKASQVFDEGLNKYQSEINASFGATDNSIRKELTDFKNTKGKANGLASLDNGGKVPSSQLPSYVDDVIEIDTFNNLPSTGESGKIYITQDTNLTYRWSGSAYTEISKSLALGETSSTAYPGDKGKSTTDIVNSLSDTLVNDVLVSQSNQDSVSLTVKSITKNSTNRSNRLLLTDGEPVLLTDGSPILLAENDGLYSQADDKTITINQASAFAAGVMSASDKTKLDGLKSQAETDTTINNMQNNLTTHINNKANPHQVTKEQVGLSNVDNTSDANKPISTATQNALNGKFSATEGNNLKQIVNNMPDYVITEGNLRHNSDNIYLNLTQQNLKNPDDAGSISLKFNPVTDSTAGIILPSDKSKIDKIITNGDGTKYLADNGQYKTVQGGNADIEAIKKYVDDSIAYARSVGYMMQLTEIDASGLDENMWYPVTIAAGERMDIRVEVLVALDSGTKPSWSTHNRGFSVRKIWEFAPYSWGVNPRSILAVHLSDFNFADTDPVRGLSTLSNYDTCYVYVRGGGNYHFYVSHGAIVILHTDTYAPGSGSQSISPTTEIPDLIQEEGLLPDWHSIKNVLDNGNEFNFADGEVGEQVWLNYRSRSGNTVSAGKLYIGNGQATGGFAEVHASGFFKESDIRLKSNIVPLNHTLEQICNIPTVSFDIRDKHQIGTIAQDIENDFADIVDTDSDGMKSVDYCMLGVVAVEGIKLLKQEIEDLKKQVEELKNGNEILDRNL